MMCHHRIKNILSPQKHRFSQTIDTDIIEFRNELPLVGSVKSSVLFSVSVAIKLYNNTLDKQVCGLLIPNSGCNAKYVGLRST